MWWGIGLGALLWIVLFIWLGLRTLRNGHGWMFFFRNLLPAALDHRRVHATCAGAGVGTISALSRRKSHPQSWKEFHDRHHD